MSEQSPYSDLSSREAFGKVLAQIGEEYGNIFALSADLASSVKLDDFISKFPERFINFGVAEQNMMGAAAGLTLAGKIPFACTYAVFSSMRACEQVRTDIAYNGLPVRIISTHSGISFGIAGATHHAIEDIGIFRGMPNMSVFSPADAVETAAIIRAIMDTAGPVYVRLSRVKEKSVYEHEFNYRVGQPDLIRAGKDLILIATGAEVGEAKETMHLLQDDGVNAGLLNISSIKPIDEQALVDILREYPAAMTIEQHNIINGLGSAIAEIIAQNNLNIRFLPHGLKDIFTTSGPYKELLHHYQLDSLGIYDIAKSFIEKTPEII